MALKDAVGLATTVETDTVDTLVTVAVADTLVESTPA